MNDRIKREFVRLLSAGALALLAAGCGQRAPNPADAAKAAATRKALQAQADSSGISSQIERQGNDLSKSLSRRAKVLSEQKGGQ